MRQSKRVNAMDSAWEVSADNLVEALRHQLNRKDLHPERRTSRYAFSPQLSYGRHFGQPRPATKAAAVMVLLEPSGAEPSQTFTIPLTVRPMHLPDHPGQVSLPGGRLEGNETFQQAAEREFCEELGVSQFPGRVAGELSPLYVYNSDYWVRVFVAACDAPQQYTPCNYEVEKVLRLPIDTLLRANSHSSQRFSRGRVSWGAPVISVGPVAIWGATAIMLGELATVLRQLARKD